MLHSLNKARLWGGGDGKNYKINIYTTCIFCSACSPSHEIVKVQKTLLITLDFSLEFVYKNKGQTELFKVKMFTKGGYMRTK